MVTSDDLAEFDEYWLETKAEVDDYIADLLEDEEEFADMRRLLNLAMKGGKRVRPTLCLLMADVTDCSEERALAHAAIIELLHNATIVSDDWVDEDEFRRDLPAVWRVLFGISDRVPDSIKKHLPGVPEELNAKTATVLTAHDLQAIAFKLARDPRVWPAISTGVRAVFRGFWLEGRNMASGAWTGGYDKYIEVCKYKTGGFFALSTWMPAIHAPVSEPVEEAARKYGESIGILYQITDDYCDGDLHSDIDHPAAEMEEWYEMATGHIEHLPVEPGSDAATRLRVAPAWTVYRMLIQEGADLRPDFLPLLAADDDRLSTVEDALTD